MLCPEATDLLNDMVGRELGEMSLQKEDKYPESCDVNPPQDGEWKLQSGLMIKRDLFVTLHYHLLCCY